MTSIPMSASTQYPGQAQGSWFGGILIPGILSLVVILNGCKLQEKVGVRSPSGPTESSAAPSLTAPLGSDSTLSAATSSSSSIPGGARAVQIIFSKKYPTGSFDEAPASGTRPAPGAGHPAIRVFNADGSLLASGGPTATSWPKWLSGFEIGISGSTNTAATNSDCARFTKTGETATCVYGYRSNTSASPKDCLGPTDYLRVSEVDCVRVPSSITTGNGGPGDGVYLRATFSRNTAYLGAGENILAVLEYAASGLNHAAPNPANCFSGGVLDPGACADMYWNVYLKHNTYEVVQPFLMLVPPLSGFVDSAAGYNASPLLTGTGGGSFASKQIFMPFAGDSQLSVLQISRIRALPINSADFVETCSSSNSPRCVGMIFRKITFFRI